MISNSFISQRNGAKFLQKFSKLIPILIETAKQICIDIHHYPSRNRSASDSAVHDKRHQRDRTDRIELTVEVRNIAPSKSFDSAEQVICILYEKDYDDDKKWRMHISSEPQRRVSGRIVFRTSFPLDYVFERTQLIKVEM
ncbi:hypothetical protein AB6A40_005568 [Gnathostoma spinigerum]|uniref:Uncharacterized protein n=1 Tax=Gnathostoma spinigerum TaxID=75299 RepID=A0ABD6ENG2_9BILA